MDDGSGHCVVSSPMGDLKAHASDGVTKNASVIVSVRPEDVELSEAPPEAAAGENICKGIVAAKDFLGDYLDFHVRVGDVVVQAKAHPSLRTPTGDPIHLRMKAEKCIAIATDKRRRRAEYCHDLRRRRRGCGDPSHISNRWMPASAGMTIRVCGL